MAGIHQMLAAASSARLLSQLRFEGPNGGTTFADDVAGVAWTKSDFAVISTAQYRDGSSSMHCPNANGYDGLNGPSALVVPAGTSATKFVIEADMYVTDINGFQAGANVLCGQPIYGPNGEQWFGLASGKITYSRASAHPGGAFTMTGTTTVAVNEWHRLKMSYDGTTIRLYLDDVLEASAPNSYGWHNTGNAFTLGYSLVWGYDPWRQALRGYLDYFRAVRP